MFRIIVNPGHLHIEPIDTITSDNPFSYDRPPDPLLSRKYPLYCEACMDPKNDTPERFCPSCADQIRTLYASTPLRLMPPASHHCSACGGEIGEDGNAQGLCKACMRNFG